jgi:hypothetical protein
MRTSNISGFFKSAGFAGLAASVLLAMASFTTPEPAAAGPRSHPVYMYGGNEFIIRKMPAGGGRVYIYAYRAAGGQWEPHSIATIDPRSESRGSSIPERIYRRGRYLGHVSVDLDNPINTHLNLYPGR